MSAIQDKRVVLIEDNLDYIEMLTVRLNINGYNVFSADNGLDGLQLVREILPDLVILDLKMPALTQGGDNSPIAFDEHMGQKICRMIKYDAKLKHIPVLMLTSSDTFQDIEHSMQSGADGYLMKTASMELIIREVDKLAKMRRKKRNE